MHLAIVENVNVNVEKFSNDFKQFTGACVVICKNDTRDCVL